MAITPDNSSSIPRRNGSRRTLPSRLSRRIFGPRLGPALIGLATNRLVIVAALATTFIWTGRVMRPIAAQSQQPPLSLPYEFVESPNFDDRPPGAEINCIVLHATVEPTTEGTMNIFLASPRHVSAHFVVGRDGRVVQMVRVEKRAFHAGPSVLDGIPKVNDYSVGIEMVNLNDGKDPYPPEQMEAVAGIIRHIRSRYDIPDSRIVSHAQIALPVGRKTDPAGFDFDKIRAMAAAIPDAAPRPAPQLSPLPPR
jgi:N-acetyl-anhydromuramyl-L-alanine amidase AmpD